MARSRLLDPINDLITDGGDVLWSFVRGEQLEFPITLNFVEDALSWYGNANNRGYVYEAVVVEANNTVGQTTTPTTIKTNGITNVLTVRVPSLIGTWDAASAYNKEEVVYYSVNGKYYKLLIGAARTSAVTPVLDTAFWAETTINKVYLQFPKSLGTTWTQTPTVETPVYGFFELRVTEPQDATFVRTWKPVRGMVELLFSPTYSSND
jgi:hypothetical protein